MIAESWYPAPADPSRSASWSCNSRARPRRLNSSRSPAGTARRGVELELGVERGRDFEQRGQSRRALLDAVFELDVELLETESSVLEIAGEIVELLGELAVKQRRLGARIMRSPSRPQPAPAVGAKRDLDRPLDFDRSRQLDGRLPAELQGVSEPLLRRLPGLGVEQKTSARSGLRRRETVKWQKDG